MIDVQKLLHCFPDPADDMMVRVTDDSILIINTEEDCDQDFSRISLRTAPTGILLKYIAVSGRFQGCGYCRKILSALFGMCLEHELPLNVEHACGAVLHVFDSLVRSCEEIADYVKVPPDECGWLGPRLEISFKSKME